MFTSKCPLKVQISQVLGPFFQIELLKTGRTSAGRRFSNHSCDGMIYGSLFVVTRWSLFGPFLVRMGCPAWCSGGRRPLLQGAYPSRDLEWTYP